MSNFMRKYFRLRYEDPIKIVFKKREENEVLLAEYYNKKEQLSKRLDCTNREELDNLLSIIYQMITVLCEECYMQGVIDCNDASAKQE